MGSSSVAHMTTDPTRRPTARVGKIALNADNLHRGNGFVGGRGHFNPEVQILDKAPVPAGAEMWKISQDGTRTLVARTGTLKRWEIAT